MACCTICSQISLLLWKRWCEMTKSKWDVVKVLLPAILFFILLLLLYSVVTVFHGGALEPFLVPLAFWTFVQRIVVQIMYEKSTRLQESMRMMGLKDSAYWISYFISDGVILGCLLAFIGAILSAGGGLFNEANFGTIWGFLWVFCMAAVCFGFFLCSFFDTPQTSGQATLGILLGLYITYMVVIEGDLSKISPEATQVICCLVPPLALQIGSGSFLGSHTGLTISGVSGILIADIFIYSILAWYFSQVWPSKVGIPKPFYFIVSPTYWFPALHRGTIQYTSVSHRSAPENLADAESDAFNDGMEEIESGNTKRIPTEKANEKLLGKPSVVVHKMRKSFGAQVAVNDLSFDMYENQIFALLGHNGAGKTTAMNALTGLTNPDWGSEANATIYGNSILTDMDQVRLSMGVCPQHDVLFENLTVRQHVIFFARLKGATAKAANDEVESLLAQFHLDKRLHHLGNELSGGQRRKLSVAIAVCGGSKFVLLDEPSAGMDPLARRELWDLLASLRKGRTILLTTHYMDEADILGDRVGIMSLGQMQCCGSAQFLKTTYGTGYKLIFDKKKGMTKAQEEALTKFVQSDLPEASQILEDGNEGQALYCLPFASVKDFGNFFERLDRSLSTLHVNSYGVAITSLEDVFLKVGEDHTVKPKKEDEITGIGAAHAYESNFLGQVIGIAGRKLKYSLNDFITIPLLLLPIAAIIAAAVLYAKEILAPDDATNNIFTIVIYAFGYLGAPGLIAEFVVRERNDKLRNVLTVMGCDFRAYWLGTFIADYLIMSIPMVVMWICWGAADMPDFWERNNGLCFFLTILFTAEMVAFSYFFSFLFANPKTTISVLPIVILLLIIAPIIIILIVISIAQATGTTVSSFTIIGINLWGIMTFSPHGGIIVALLTTVGDYGITNMPPIGATIAFMIFETAAMLAFSYFTDIRAIAKVTFSEQADARFDQSFVAQLDEDVLAERQRAIDAPSDSAPLVVKLLRKVFYAKSSGKSKGEDIVASQDVSFVVESGEVLGLLGANGAGKTTVLSMLTRQLTADRGDAFVNGYSVLREFSKGATNLGVVTQSNSLWDKLSVQDHLFLFARLRGVPEKEVQQIVDGTIDQLELTPHRHKLSMRLSGGMKRKLCVAIALIGDPKVVLLDEPSAGLDPVSRHNLWSVIMRTMSHRAVILTTHSMDEAEFLCKRIGIMTTGQLRALGTKQHLKTKFGSGFELEIKLRVHDFDKQLTEITNFVKSLAPSSQLISENGGLLTFEIPRAEMRMGAAFGQLESNKKNLHIEYYSIAQPTLEQVFIRTVKRYDQKSEH